MRDVRLEAEGQHFRLVERKEFLRVFPEEVGGDDLLRGVFVFLTVQAVHTAEIRDAALRGDPGAAEKDDVAAACYDLS